MGKRGCNKPWLFMTGALFVGVCQIMSVQLFPLLKSVQDFMFRAATKNITQIGTNVMTINESESHGSLKLEWARRVTRELKRMDVNFCVVTTPRGNNTSYIYEVLLSIQQDTRPGMNVNVLVVDVSQSERSDLLAAQRAFPRFAFQRLANTPDEPSPRNDPAAA